MWPFSRGETSAITLFNTKGRTKELFVPLKRREMKMYSCGPTVYDFVHIGNLRSFVFSDLVRRTFEYAGYKVTQIMNITDFGHLTSNEDEGEDKMMKGLKREGMEPTMENMAFLANRYIDAFKEDSTAMNIKKPHVMPRASEHVEGMKAYVETLLHKGYAYKTSDGIYFDTQKFPDYGVLGGSSSAEHSRTGVLGEKKNPRDFAIWKFNHEMGWDASWGRGFPGWHIECVAMSTRYLGKTFDIHTGGIDHVPVHHNNEIAQAECANSKPYVRYWLHNEFITIDARRVGKSEGNAITLRQLTDRGISPLAYRYWLLTGHYRSPMNFTWEAVMGAQTAWHRAHKLFADMPKNKSRPDTRYLKEFETAITDDFNTPECIATLWKLLKDDAVPGAVKRATILQMDKVLGLGFSHTTLREAHKTSMVEIIPEDVAHLVQERELARKEQNFHKADELRKVIERAGFTITDTPRGPSISRTSMVE